MKESYWTEAVTAAIKKLMAKLITDLISMTEMAFVVDLCSPDADAQTEPAEIAGEWARKIRMPEIKLHLI